MKRNRKKRLAIVLSAVLVMSLLYVAEPYVPGSTYKIARAVSTTWVESDGRTISLSTDGMCNPTSGDTPGLTGWEGSYVYYGKKDDGSPLKYRVLKNRKPSRYWEKDYQINENNAASMRWSERKKVPGLFLDCDEVIKKTPFCEVNSTNHSTNTWEATMPGTYTLRKYLNGCDKYGENYTTPNFYESSFNETERNSIATVYNITAYSVEDNCSIVRNDYAYGGEDLVDDHVFVLNAADATNPEFGYDSTGKVGATRLKYYNGEACSWWLRSPWWNSSNNAGVVYYRTYDAGKLLYADVATTSTGVSPALMVDMECILFSSLISGTAGSIGANYKLAIKDPKMVISQASGANITEDNGVVTVPYTISGDNSGNATSASVLILDEEYTPANTNDASIKYYKKLDGSFSNSGASGSFTLPSDYDPSWKIYIIAEDINGQYETDFVSEPVQITLPGSEPVNTANPSAAPSGEGMPLASPSAMPTATASATPSASATPTASATPSNTPKPTVSPKVTTNPDGSTTKITDTVKPDGTKIHKEVNTAVDGTKTTMTVKTATNGNITVTDQVKYPSGVTTTTTTKIIPKTDKNGKTIGQTVAITKVITNDKTKSVTISKTIKIEGKSYPVTVLSKGFLNSNKKKPKEVVIKASRITKVEKGAFKGLSKNGTIAIKAGSKDFKRIKKLIVASGLPKGVKIKRLK